MNIIDIDKYVKDTRQLNNKQKIEYFDGIEKDLREYWIKLNKETTGKTPYVWLSAVKMFLTMNKSLELDDVYMRLQRNGHGNYAITDTKTPTKEQLLKIFSYSNPESKAMFMFQLTSGQRINEVIEVTFDKKKKELGHIEMGYDCPRIFYPKTKTRKNVVKTRVTPECKKIIQEYLDQRDKFIDIRIKRGEHLRKEELDRDKLFPMNKSTANTIWTTMVKNAGLYELDPNTHKPVFGTHCLRRYFLSHFGDETWGDFFSGHITARNKEYRKYADEKLDLEYNKHITDLNIFETADTTDIRESLAQKDKSKDKRS